MLEQIEVLLFSGEQDLICAHTGTERLVDRLEWDGQQGFGVRRALPSRRLLSRLESLALTGRTQTPPPAARPEQNATVSDWFLGEDKVGEWTTRGNLTYAKVRLPSAALRPSRMASLTAGPRSRQVADSSHMVPYDVPAVANDMMLRFMEVDLGALAGGTASQPSRVGAVEKVIVGLADGGGAAGGGGKGGDGKGGQGAVPPSSKGGSASDWEGASLLLPASPFPARH